MEEDTAEKSNPNEEAAWLDHFQRQTDRRPVRV